MFPRPGEPGFLFKKKGDRQIKCLVWFGFNAFILALLLPVCSPDQSYIRVFVYKVIVMENKIK